MLLFEILTESENRAYWFFPPEQKMIPVGRDKYGETLHIDVLHDQPELFGITPQEAKIQKALHLSQSKLGQKVFDAGWVRVRVAHGTGGGWIALEGSPEGLKHPNVQRLIMRQKKSMEMPDYEFAVFLDALDTDTGKILDSEHFGINQPSDLFKMNRWLGRL